MMRPTPPLHARLLVEVTDVSTTTDTFDSTAIAAILCYRPTTVAISPALLALPMLLLCYKSAIVAISPELL